MPIRLAALLLLATLPLACGPCCGDVVGDASQPMQVQALVDDGDSYAPVPDGGSVPLIVGGQGALMIAVTARAKNAALCGALVNGRLVDLESGEVLAEQGYDFDIYDGTQPDAGAIAARDVVDAIQLLPCSPATKAFLDKPVRLELDVTDTQGRTGKAEQIVVPTCPAGSEYCRTSCSPP